MWQKLANGVNQVLFVTLETASLAYCSLSVDLSASMSWGNRGLQADRQAAALYKIKLLCIGRDYEFSYKWGVNALGFAPGVHSSELAISSMA